VCGGQTDAEAVQTASLNHSPHFAQLRHSHLGQKIEQRQCFGALLQGTFLWECKGKFRNDGRMDHNLPIVQMLPHFFVYRAVSRTKVVNPNRGVRENQFCPGLRRGIFFNFGMVPCRDAKRRALSRSMRALSASRISAVFSATPVNSWAMRTRSSSSATVVLIALIIASNDVIYRAKVEVLRLRKTIRFASRFAPLRTTTNGKLLRVRRELDICRPRRPLPC